MTLDTLQLDDLQWSDLTTVAREKIAGVSGGQWTHHAPVDPGITLLELYASQLEQRLYQLDQPSDELERALLNLLGFQPQTAKCAKTVMCFFEGDDFETCPELETIKGQNPIVSRQNSNLVFRYLRNINLLPFKFTQPSMGGRRRDRKRVIRRPQVEIAWSSNGKSKGTASELNRSAPVCLFDPHIKNAETKISFKMDGSIVPSAVRKAEADQRKIPPTNPQKIARQVTISILFELSTPKGIAPSWKRNPEGDHVELDSATRVKWQLSIQDNEESALNHPVEIRKTVDGTMGLRQSGIIEFTVEPKDLAEASTANCSIELLISADTREFTFIPRVRQIVPNAVVAEHRRRKSIKQEIVINQPSVWKKLPGIALSIPLEREEFLLTGPGLIQVCLQERLRGKGNSAQHTWTPTTSLIQCNSKDRFFVADRDSGTLTFGDGINGRIPIPVEPSEIEIIYETGGGLLGNVAANLVWSISTPFARCFNPVPAVGGENPESTEDTIRRCRSELGKPARAITKMDIEQLAVETPNAGIGRVHAVLGLHPEFPSVPTPGAMAVFIVPDLPDSIRQTALDGSAEDLVAIDLDPGTQFAVSKWLAPKRLLTQQIFVSHPSYVELDLEVVISGAAFDRELLTKEIRRSLSEYLHPLFGGRDGLGWPFGGPVRPSELLRVVQKRLDHNTRVSRIGIRSKNNSRDQESSRATAFESCRDVTIGSHSLVALRNVSVKYSNSDSGTGGLQ